MYINNGDFMEYIDLKQSDDYSLLKKAGMAIKSCNLVLFPTETVYGIGADGLNEEAILKIFKAKGRKTDNPLILHVSNYDMVNKIAKNINDLEKKLMDAFWPGPLTIVLDKTDIVPFIATGNLATVGVRMPSNKIALKLIEYANTPIAAPSANVSGKPSGTNIKDIFKELESSVEFIVDGGETDIGLESTVVRVIDGEINILRPGKIRYEDLLKITDKIKIDKHVLNKVTDETSVMSPGMKYKHYAPASDCLLIYSSDEKKMINYINSIIPRYKNPIILTHTNYNYVCKTLNMGSNLEEISHNMFKTLREVDTYNPDIVIIEGVSKEGLGLAIMNRLLRASSYNYYEL